MYICNFKFKGKPIKEPMIFLLNEAIKNTGIRKDTLFRMIDFQVKNFLKNNLKKIRIFLILKKIK